VFIFAEKLFEKAGGPNVSIPQFSKSLSKKGVDNVIFCKSERLDKEFRKNEVVNVVSYKSLSDLIKSFIELKNKTLKRNRILHVNFLWQPELLLICLLGFIYNFKVIINSRGMLNKEAFTSGSKLKYPIFHFFVRPIFLLVVDYFQCSSSEEIEAIKKYFPRKKNFLNILGYKRIKNISKSDSKQKYLTKTIVSISRIDNHKKLDILIDQFIKSNLGRNGWKLKIFGASDLSEYKKYTDLFCKNILDKNKIYLNLFVSEKEKIKILQNSSFFVSASKSESFGLSIAESLDVETPIIIRNNTIWEKYISLNCGYSFKDNGLGSIFEKLDKLNYETYSSLHSNIKKHFNPLSWEKHVEIFLNEVNY